MERNGLRLESFWTRHYGLLSFLIAAGVSAYGIAQDLFLAREGVPRWGTMLLSNVITGVIAGILFHQFARSEKTRRELVRERMQTVAELNHHIRNALQVIRFWGEQQRSALDAMQLQLITESVNRIEWALREILPKYPEDSSAASSEPERQDSAAAAKAAVQSGKDNRAP